MKTTRRMFLKHGGIALASVGLLASEGPEFLRRAAYAMAPARDEKKAGGKKTLICIFQRGAVDGMSMVVPHGDKDYYNYRPAGGIAIPNTGNGSTLDLDGFFGLHPALAPLKPIYDAGQLAPIQAVGSPNGTRSHFDAQDFMESGVIGDKAIKGGWLARALANCPEDKARRGNPLRGLAVTNQLPRSLQGFADAVAIPDLKTFGVGATSGSSGSSAAQTTAGAFEALYNHATGDTLHGAGEDLFAAMKRLDAIRAERYVPANGAQYPRGRFGDSLQQAAQLIKSEVGVEIAFADVGGWDTHVNQGGAQGQLATRLTEFGAGLAALYKDLGDRMDDVVILTMTEFGRTARQNGNNGTDHGHATCFFALGGPVNGGKVLGQWPGLAMEQLYEKRDLALTTDFRDVFGEIASKHLGITNLNAVFPGYSGKPEAFRGVVKG